MSEPRPKRRMIAIATGVVAVVLVALVVLLAGRTTSPATSVAGPLVGKDAPGASGSTVDGLPASLDSLRGRPVVVNFVASWCGPCKTEAPQLEAFAYDQSKRPDGAEVLGVTFNDSTSAMRRYIAAQGVTYPVLVDPGGTMASDWGVASPPTTFVVSPSGKVAVELLGAVTVADLERAVKEARGRG